MKTALEERIQRAEEIANTLKHFKREVALAAEHSKTGKSILQKLLTDMESKGVLRSFNRGSEVLQRHM